MNKRLEKLQNQREVLERKNNKLAEIADNDYAQYKPGDFIPYFLTRSFAIGAQEAITKITDSAIERPYNSKVANAIHKGACYAFAGATTAFFAAGLLPFAVLETPVAAVGSGIEGLKELDRTVYNNRTAKARKKLANIQEEMKVVDAQIAELSSQRVC